MMSEQPYYEYLKDNWKNTMFGGQNGYATFQGFWDSALHDGIYSQNSASSVAYTSALFPVELQSLQNLRSKFHFLKQYT